MELSYKIFDTLLDSVFVVDQKLKVVYCNEMGAQTADLSIKRILRGIPFNELFSFEDQDFAEILHQISEASSYREMAFKDHNSKVLRGQMSIQKVGNLENSHWIIYIRDVTLEETLQKKYRSELDQKERVIEDLKKAKLELENYSKNLEKMVEERTHEIQKLNEMLGAILESLGQGFFVFNSEGFCLPIFTKACESILEIQPPGKKADEVLKIPKEKKENFKKWMSTLFMELLPFQDLAPLGPELFPHSGGNYITLEYYPLRSQNQVEGVVVVASDKTSEMLAKKEAELQRAYAKMIVTLVKNRRQLITFISDAQKIILNLKEELGKKDSYNEELLFRLVHTLKGGASLFSISSLMEACHAFEDLLSQDKEKIEKRKDHLQTAYEKMESIFEDFLKENKDLFGRKLESSDRLIEISVQEVNKFGFKIFEENKKLYEEFVDHFLKEEISKYFLHYSDLAVSLAERLGKKLNPLKFYNAQFKILPEPYLELFNSLVHAFRNAIDHGIEFPEERLQKGKSEFGTLEVHFFHFPENNTFKIQISDDGSGIDPDKIRKKLQEKNRLEEHLSDFEVIQCVFENQFSTREEVSELSGRGVGLNAVYSLALELKGKAWVLSRKNEGTDLFIEIPYLKTVLNS